VELLFVEIHLVRKIRAEERQNTLDAMSITQNLMEVADMCMLGYKASSCRLKLEDTEGRIKRILGENAPTIERVHYWVERLSGYQDEDPISEEDGTALANEIDKIRAILAQRLGA
jgi:hypothetical protein